MQYIRVIFLFFLVTQFYSCSPQKKIATLKPEADDAAPLVYDVAPSFINMPVSMSLKDIENQLNIAFDGVIFDDQNIQDDDLMVKVTKESPVQVKQSNGKIMIVLPLKVVGKIKYGFTKLGVNFSDTRDFKMNGVVTLISEVRLENWKLKTHTTLQSLDWKEPPTVAIAGREVAITSLMNASLKFFKKRVETAIDEAITASVDFKPEVLNALQSIAKPLLVNESLKTWFQLTPIELYATKVLIQKDFVTIGLGLKCQMETRIGNPPKTKFNASKIILRPVEKLPNLVKAHVVAVATYKDASQLMQANFNNQVFEDGNRKVTVKNVALWHKQGKMIVALNLAGSLNGTVYLSGLPQYNPTTQEIYFDQLNYVLDTKNVLMQSANWLAQGKILKVIQDNCRFSIAPNLQEGQQKILEYLNNYSPSKGVFINGKSQEIKFLKIQLTNQSLVAELSVEGQVKVTIDGM